MKKLREIFGSKVPKPNEPYAVNEPFKLIANRTSAEICSDFELQEEARPHLNGEPAPHEFVNRLFGAGLYADATRFLAYGLPKRQAVWWACLCVRSVPACCGDEISTESLKSAEVWAKDPSEYNREGALTTSGKHNFEMPGAPAAWAAMAAGWADETPATTEQEDIPAPPEHLTAHAASGAIILAATANPDQANQVYREFLEKGVQIAQGKMQISE